MELHNKIALVTGASRGIGRQIALDIAMKGAFVIGTATSVKGADNITSYFKENNVNGLGCKLDLTDNDDIVNIMKFIKEHGGSPDILINNAGITRDNLMLRMTDAQWDDVILTNLTAIFKLSKLCIKGMMKKRWGRIISIGSVVGSSGNPGQTNYCSAKSGLIGFSKSLAIEVASRNITVNVVAPGFIKTDMTDGLTDEQKSRTLAVIPSGKMGSPQDISSAVCYLAGEDAGYVTGNTLHVNGGMYMA